MEEGKEKEIGPTFVDRLLLDLSVWEFDGLYVRYGYPEALLYYVYHFSENRGIVGGTAEPEHCLS